MSDQVSHKSELRKRYEAKWGETAPEGDSERPAYIPWLEAKLSKMEEALNFIAFTGTDCPAGYERDSFYRGQLHGTIAAAAAALAGGDDE